MPSRAKLPAIGPRAVSDAVTAAARRGGRHWPDRRLLSRSRGSSSARPPRGPRTPALRARRFGAAAALLALGALAWTAPAHAQTDNMPPAIRYISIDSSAGTDDTYAIGDKIEMLVAFDRVVAVTGTPELEVDIGGAGKAFAYDSIVSATTSELAFAYTVAAGDADTDGISVAANKLTLPGGATIMGTLSGTAAILTHAAVTARTGHKVDGVRPALDSLSASTTAPHVTLIYSEDLDTGSTPAAGDFTVTVGGVANAVTNVTIDGKNVELDLTTAPAGGDTVTVSYTPATDPIQDLAGNAAARFTGKSVTINTPPAISYISIDSSAGTDDTYAIGDEIEILVAFDGAVAVTGTPELEVDIGGAGKAFAYDSINATTSELAFAYTVAAGDADTDGISVAANKLTLPGGATIMGTLSGTAAILTHDALAADAAHKVDGVRPALDSLSASTTAPHVTLTYSEDLDTGSTPAAGDFTVTVGRVANAVTNVTIDGKNVELDLTTAPAGGDTVTVRYAPGTDPLRDGVGNDAQAFSGETATVAAGETPPAVVSVAIVSDPGTDGVYAIGDAIEVAVTFDAPVEVSGAPELEVEIGRAARAAAFDRAATGAGPAAAAAFAYTVAEGDADADGVAIAAGRLTLPGGAAIRGTDGADADLTHDALAADAAHKVDGVRPALERGAVDGAALTLTWSEPLADGLAVAPGAFEVRVDGHQRAVADGGVAIDGARLTLTLAAPVFAGETVTVGYAPPVSPAGGDPVRDAPGNAAAAFEARPVRVTSAPPRAEPGMTLTPMDLDLDEGGSGTYTVVLDSEPSADVTVTISGHAGTDVTPSADTLTFTPANWSEAQTVTVSAAEDDDAVADAEVTLTHTVTGADAGYAALDPATVTVRVAENDTAGVTVTPMTLDLDEGGSGSYTVVLDSEPSADVAVTISGHAGTDVTPSADTLTFTPANWSEAQSVTVSAAEDDDAIADAEVTLTHTVTSADAGYAALDPATVTVRVAENDTAGVTVTPMTLDLDEGGSGSYTVVLDSEPSADVTVTISGHAGTDVTPSADTLTFTPANWSEAQSVTVSAAEDDDAIADAEVTLTHTVTGADAGYAALDPATVTVRVAENDTAGVTVTPMDLDLDEGGSGSYTVVLDSEPSADVAVTISGHAGTDVTPSADTLTFTPANWSEAQSVTVSAAEDDDAIADAEVTLTHTVTSADAGYAALDPATVTVTVAENDADAAAAAAALAWQTRFGRVASDNVIAAIGNRLRGDAARAQPNHLTVGGWRLDALLAPPDASAAERAAERDVAPLGELRWARMERLGAGRADGHRAGAAANGGPAGGMGGLAGGMGGGLDDWRPGTGSGRGSGAPTLRAALMRSSFFHAFAGDAAAGAEASAAGRRWAMWGDVAGGRFGADDGGLSLDGEVATATIGFDGQGVRWLGGVALSYSEGDGEYGGGGTAGGTLTSTLAGLHPYFRYAFGERGSVWGVLGYSEGELRLTPEGAETALETDLTTSMAAFGGRAALFGGSERFELSLLSDVRLTHTAAAAAPGLAQGEGTTGRVRVMAEGAGTMTLGNGAVLRPMFEAGLRYDDGDAETGGGFEVGAGLAYTAGRLTAQLNARGLLAHEAADYEEWGVSGSLLYRGYADGRGLSARLGSAWGATQSGVRSLWTRDTVDGLARGAAAPAAAGRYWAEFGYGLDGPRGRALWTPYVGVDAGGGRALRLGLNFVSGPNAEFGLELGRRDGGGEAAQHAIELRGALRW